MNTPQSDKSDAWVVFASGFRPFFLAAVCLSGTAIVYWTLLFLGKAPAAALSYYPPVIWHMHEMIFGYVGAVIAGFLLTAVINWTGRQTLRGWSLAVLLIIWLGARCLPFFGEGTAWVVAMLNTTFFVYLAVAIGIPIIRSDNKRNLIMVVIVTILAMTNAMVHANLLGITNGLAANAAMSIAYYLELLLTIIIAGRVFPMFSASGLGGIYAPKKHQWLEFVCVFGFLVFAAINIIDSIGIQVPSVVLLSVSLLVAMLHTLRVLGWFHWRIFTTPLVWVLHAGYYFLIVGILLLGLSAYYAETRVPGLHAMLAGGLGLITVGMMARVSLGHTGRDIHQPHKLVSTVFILIVIATLVRVLLPLMGSQYYLAAITLSTVFWGMGFLLFFFLYVSVLFARRVDGAPG